MDNKKTNADDTEYKVEAVVDKRTSQCNGGCDGIIGCDCDGRIEYRIKWLGYGPECNTWEPVKHLYCEDLIEQFENNLKTQNKDKSEKGKATPGSRVKSIVKRKSISDNSDACDIKPNIRLPNYRKEFIEKIEHTGKSSSTHLKSYKRKSVDFKEPIARKQHVSTDTDKNKRKSDFSHPDPSSQPEKIIGAADSGGELMFLVKWKGTEKIDLVPAREANVKFTSMVVKFYEDRIQWHAGHLVASSDD